MRAINTNRKGFNLLKPLFFLRRGGRIRTYDPLLPKQMRYRAALHPEKGSAKI